MTCDSCGDPAVYRTQTDGRALCPGCADRYEATGIPVEEILEGDYP